MPGRGFGRILSSGCRSVMAAASAFFARDTPDLLPDASEVTEAGTIRLRHLRALSLALKPCFECARPSWSIQPSAACCGRE